MMSLRLLLPVSCMYQMGMQQKRWLSLLSTLSTEREHQESIIDQYLVDMLASRLIGLRKVVAMCL